MRHNLGLGIMGELVDCRTVPIYWFEICLRRRDANKVIQNVVIRAITTNAEFYAGRADQRLGMRQDKPFGNRCRVARQFGREIFALVGVEYRKPFEEGNGVGLVSIALRPSAFLVGYKAIGVNDGGAVLALADISAEA